MALKLPNRESAAILNYKSKSPLYLETHDQVFEGIFRVAAILIEPFSFLLNFRDNSPRRKTEMIASSTDNDAELRAFTNAVVNEESKNISFCEAAFNPAEQQNAYGNSIVLQSVYYSFKQNKTQPSKSSWVQIPECTLWSGKKTITPGMMTVSGIRSSENFHQKAPSRKYYNLQEGCPNVSETTFESNGFASRDNHHYTEALHVRKHDTPFGQPICVETSGQPFLRRKRSSMEIMEAQRRSTVRIYPHEGQMGSNEVDKAKKLSSDDSQMRMSTNYQEYGDQAKHSEKCKPWIANRRAEKTKALTVCRQQSTTYHPTIATHRATDFSYCDHLDIATDPQADDTSQRQWTEGYGFAEEGPIVDPNNAYATQFDSSLLNVHRERCGVPMSCDCSHDVVEPPSHHHLLETETTSQRLGALLSLENEDDMDFEERRFNQISSTCFHPDPKNQVDSAFISNTVDSFNDKEPIALESIRRNSNISGPLFDSSRRIVCRKRKEGETTVTSSEPSLNSAWIAIENKITSQGEIDDTSIWKSNKFSTQNEPDTIVNLNNHVQRIPTDIENAVVDSNSTACTLSPKEALTSLFIDNTASKTIEVHKKETIPLVPKTISNPRRPEPRHCSPNKCFSQGMPKITSLTKGNCSTRRNHINLDPKPHKCSFQGCSRAFSKKSHLTCHLTLHTGEKRYLCPWKNCGRTFRRGDERKRHYRRHTGEKPYECVYCGRRFSRSDHKKSHIQKIHNKFGPTKEGRKAESIYITETR